MYTHPLFLLDFNETWNFFQRILEKYSNIIFFFFENPSNSLGAGGLEGHDETNGSFFATLPALPKNDGSVFPES